MKEVQFGETKPRSLPKFQVLWVERKQAQGPVYGEQQILQKLL